MEYLMDKVTRFEHYFPKSSTNYLKERHYRLYLLKNMVKHYYYRAIPPKHLIQYDKIIDGSIPIIIVNYNRYNTLVPLIDWLMNLDSTVSIIIVDNASTYQPLLDFYDVLDLPNLQVLRFDENHGLNKLIAISQTMQTYDYYVVTDADLIPYSDTGSDILERMKKMLLKYKDINHIGASLEVKDIPDHYPLRDAVLKWEGQFWKIKREEEVFEAFVDTTFGMYRSESQVMKLYPALRLGKPYTLKHVDWYIDPGAINDETKFTLETMSTVSTWMTRLKANILDM